LEADSLKAHGLIPGFTREKDTKPRRPAVIDPHCAQRTTVFAAFVNLSLKEPDEKLRSFWRACAQVFVYDQPPELSGASPINNVGGTTDDQQCHGDGN
jgi:hypothetical protein